MIVFNLRTGLSYNDYTEFTFHTAPSFGMEYFFSSQFSFGAEIQLKAGFNISDPDDITLGIVAPIAVRFYMK